MNFEITDEQQQLADSLRKYLANEYGFEQRKAIVHSASGFSEAAWATFAELGLMALAVPEGDGGFGGGAVDLMPALEACGEALVVEPLLDHIGLAQRIVARAGSAAQRAALLPGLMDGSLRIAVATLEPGRRYELQAQGTRAEQGGQGWVLNGHKAVVLGAAGAAQFIVSAATATGTALFLVPASASGLSLNPCRTVDGQRAADVRLANVAVGPEAQIGSLEHLEEAVDFATALQCAEGIGALQFACDTTLEYLKTRKQFGVPIGSFQVLQHRMVEMVIHTEQARSLAIKAAAAVDAGGPARERQRVVSAAKVGVADAARIVSQEAVQLHGGMGMTEELKISHTFRRLTMIAQRFGDADHHLERYAAVSA